MAERATKQAKGAGAGKRRPTGAEIQDVLLRISEGISLRKACEELGIDPPSTYREIDADPSLRQQYVRAREMQGEHFAYQALTVAGGVLTKQIKPDAGRVVIDAYKWAAGRMAPKAWGDRQQHEHAGPDGGPIPFANLTREQRKARIAELEARRADRNRGT